MSTEKTKLQFDIDWKNLGFLLLRGLIFLAFYALLHFLYDLLPNPVFQAIAGTNESVFQHLKIGFFAFLLFIGVDYLFHLKKMENKTAFTFSRLIGAILVGWLLMFIWYMIPAIYNQEFASLAAELSLAMVVTYIAGIIAMVFAENLEKIEYKLSFKVIIIVLIVILVIFYVVFSFITPWLDVFIDPEFL
ncbi:MAG: hypothetical protein KGD64_09415 [Candidatus Heimdallarchaeota archaeon]|nr:hypothetical protein [Candidatus Heimdallarchaeota archaeon]